MRRKKALRKKKVWIANAFDVISRAVAEKRAGVPLSPLNLPHVALVGFRSEDLYGEGYRDLKAVADHEINELGNEDIIDTLNNFFKKNLSKEEVFRYIDYIYKEGFKKCIWVCDSVQDFLDEYDTSDLMEEQVYGMDRYEFRYGEYKVISDMGAAGKLVAYNKRPIVIPIGAVSRSNPRGILYYGWNSPALTTRLHYFVNGISLCMKYQHFGRPIPPSPKPFPKDRFCQICMRMLCDKIIITGVPVNMAPIRNYLRRFYKRPWLESVSDLRDKLLKSVNYSGDVIEFDKELNAIISHAVGEEFISVKESINKLEKIADWTRRTA